MFVSLSQENYLHSLITLDEIPHVYKTDTAVQSCTIPEHICTLPLLTPLKNEHEGIVKSTVAVTITVTVIITTISLMLLLLASKVITLI